MKVKHLTYLIRRYGVGIPLILLMGLPLFVLWLVSNFSNLALQVLGISSLMGFIFILSGFGFTGAWKQAISVQKTVGIRAQILFLACVIVISYPFIIDNPDMRAFVRPIGFNLLVGAFIFGVGMQLAGSCSSGSLVCAGRGQVTAWWVLLMMTIGATIAAAHYAWWLSWSQWEPVSFVHLLGWQSALMATLSLLTLAYWVSIRLEAKRYHQVTPLFYQQGKLALSKLGMGAITMTIAYILLWWVSGQPWAVTLPFALVGIHLLDWLTLPIDWQFWGFTGEYEAALNKPWHEQILIVSNLGIIIGAALASVWLFLKQDTCLLNDQQAQRSTSWRQTYLFYSIGGLLMGYGAIISFGCNIAAFIGGVASASLHGWVWLIFALLGNVSLLYLLNICQKSVTK